MNFIPNPNQRRVTIHKCDGKKNYSKIDREANFEAMRKLGYSAYMLYMIFCLNATGFKMYPSKAHICAETKLSKNVYYDAFSKLIDEGYLVRKGDSNCIFDFFEAPSLPEKTVPEKGKTYTSNGENMSPKQVENIKKYKNKTAGGGHDVPSPDRKNSDSTGLSVKKRRVFADI